MSQCKYMGLIKPILEMREILCCKDKVLEHNLTYKIFYNFILFPDVPETHSLLQLLDCIKTLY